MRHTSNPVGVSRILSGVDFGLLLIVLTCGTAGLEWLSTLSQATVHENVAPPASTQAVTDQIAALQKEIERLSRELDQKQEQADRMRQELDEAEAKRPDLNLTQAKRSQTERDLEKLQKDIEALNEQLDQLQQKQRELQEQKRRSEQLLRAIAELRKRLDDLQRQRKELEAANKDADDELGELEQLPIERPKVVVDFYPEFHPEQNRTAVGVALTERTVAPLREPYYTLERVGNRITQSRAQLGETVKEAVAAGSDFSRLLAAIDPQRQFVWLLVDSSSFETFRTVRELLKQRNVPWGWEPWDDLTTIMGGPGANTEPGTTK